jgi:hypothetical protein
MDLFTVNRLIADRRLALERDHDKTRLRRLARGTSKKNRR